MCRSGVSFSSCERPRDGNPLAAAACAARASSCATTRSCSAWSEATAKAWLASGVRWPVASRLRRGRRRADSGVRFVRELQVFRELGTHAGCCEGGWLQWLSRCYGWQHVRRSSSLQAHTCAHRSYARLTESLGCRRSGPGPCAAHVVDRRCARAVRLQDIAAEGHAWLANAGSRALAGGSCEARLCSQRRPQPADGVVEATMCAACAALTAAMPYRDECGAAVLRVWVWAGDGGTWSAPRVRCIVPHARHMTHVLLKPCTGPRLRHSCSASTAYPESTSTHTPSASPA
jgi:hypothetical protein